MNASTVHRRVGWSVFAFTLLVYVITLCPTVYWDDAGELITACHTLGIPHPPGHPLYPLIGKLFTLIPIGSIAWRVNFMSAFFGALTCMVVCRIICDRLDRSPWAPVAAFGGACFFAFAPTMWEQSTVAETSTLHAFFMTLLTLLAFRMANGKILWGTKTRSLCLFAFLFGFSLTNHVAGVFFLPAFAYVFLSTYGREMFAPRLLMKMAGSFALGLTVYAYLPLRSLADPVIDWGNPETLENFIWVVTAKQFAPNLSMKPNIFMISSSLVLRGKDLLHQFTLPGCVFAAIGMWTLARKEGRFIVFSLLVIAVLFYIGLNSAFISAYFIPALALLSVWLGVGIHQCCVLMIRVFEKARTLRLAAWLRTTACVVPAMSFILPLGLHFQDMDRSNAYYAREYGEKLLASLPADSALFTTDGYALFILWYLIYCEGRRPDLLVVEPTWLWGSNALTSQIRQQHPSLVFPSREVVAEYASRSTDIKMQQYLMIQAVLDANCPQRPVFWGMIPHDLPFERNLVPEGIVFRYSTTPVKLDKITVSQNQDFWEKEIEILLREPGMREDKLALEIYPVELNNQGIMFDNLGYGELARWAVKLALKFNPDFPISRYNLARFNSEDKQYEAAIENYQRALQGNPYMAIAYYGMGNAYRSCAKYDDAFLAYRRATQLFPGYHEAHTALGQLYSLVGQTNDAIERFRRALEIEPSYTFAMRGLATAYLDVGRMDEAKRLLDQSLQLEPDSAAGLFVLAKYYAYAGDKGTAKNVLARSIAIGGNGFLEAARSDDALRDLVG